MTQYEPAGIVHRGEWIIPGPQGTIICMYWDECQGRRVREMFTREEWEEAMKEDDK